MLGAGFAGCYYRELREDPPALCMPWRDATGAGPGFLAEPHLRTGHVDAYAFEHGRAMVEHPRKNPGRVAGSPVTDRTSAADPRAAPE